MYPASAGNAPDDAVLRGQAEWGQGERGAAGYEDSGRSEINYTEEELRLIREGKWPLEGRKGAPGGEGTGEGGAGGGS